MSGGEAHDCPPAKRLIRRTKPARKLLGDRAYDSAPLRQWLNARGTRAVIPNKSNRKQPFSFDRKSYKRRHRIENAFCRLKDFRRIATRYDRLARNFLASVCLVAAVVWWILRVVTLVARKQLLGRLIDVELSIRGILRGFGLKVGPVTRKGFEARIRELVTGQATLERVAGAMLSARAALKAEYEKLHKTVLAIVREDSICRRLMTVPSVGPLVAITYKSAMDDPNRIAKSKAAGDSAA